MLTRRQTQILKLIAHGCSNKEIAENLSISESTVENHIHQLYKRLKISNRAQAVSYALRLEMGLEKQEMGASGIA